MNYNRNTPVGDPLSRVHSVKHDVGGIVGLLNYFSHPDKGLYTRLVLPEFGRFGFTDHSSQQVHRKHAVAGNGSFWCTNYTEYTLHQ